MMEVVELFIDLLVRTSNPFLTNIVSANKTLLTSNNSSDTRRIFQLIHIKKHGELSQLHLQKL